MKQSNWGRDRFSAYRWYEKSIEGGSPYSMFKLSGEDGTDYVCEVNGWECSEENLDKALERWKELAELGDVKAEYYYKYYSRSLLEVAYDTWFGYDLENSIMNAAEKGYYQPLIWSIKIAHREGYRELWGDELYRFLLDHIDKDLKIAMHFVYEPYEGMAKNTRRELFLDSLKKGYQIGLFDRFIAEEIISHEEAYVFNKANYLGKKEDYDEAYYAKEYGVPEKKYLS